MSQRKIRILIGVLAIGGAIVASMLIRVKQSVDDVPDANLPRLQASEFANFSSTPPQYPMGLAFLHHSIGQQWLADAGADSGDGARHPNGGGLRRRLAQSGYQVHDATYGSILGEHTDLFDWLPKFTAQMDDVLHVAHQDDRLPQPDVNRLVVFKSCFPNSYFVAEGIEPGKPLGPELTVTNAKVSFRALLPVLQQHPDTLFVFVTTPPFVASAPRERLLKVVIKRILGRPPTAQRMREQARFAREFRDWIIDPHGWLAGYPQRNVVVFDYYAILTRQNRSLFLDFPSGDGLDSHPNAEANQLASDAFIPFLNRAMNRLARVD